MMDIITKVSSAYPARALTMLSPRLSHWYVNAQNSGVFINHSIVTYDYLYNV